MNTIFWSFQRNIEGKYEGLALKEIDEFAVNISEFPFIAEEFNSSAGIIHYLTELQKPLYYSTYGANYELKYIEADSLEWSKLLEKWQKTITEIECQITPWYKKLWEKIKGAF